MKDRKTRSSSPSAHIEALEARQLLAAAPWGAIPRLIGQDQAIRDFPHVSGRGQTVAILDTGVDYNHPWLGGQWGKTVIGGYDFVDNDSDPMDQTGHGTMLAGIIAARPFIFDGQRYRGLVPGAKIVALRIEDNTDNLPDSRIAQALQWVIDHRQEYHITAVNMSFGDGHYLTKHTQPAYGAQLAALNRAGIFIAAASGNEGTAQPGINYPAADPAVFSVGAMNSAGQISSFTSRGPALNLLAPGEGVPSTLYDIFHHTHSFEAASGTSFSTAFAVGAAVLLKQLNPRLTPSQIARTLRSTGTASFDPATGAVFRRLNLENAMLTTWRRKRAAAARARKARATEVSSSANSIRSLPAPSLPLPSSPFATQPISLMQPQQP